MTPKSIIARWMNEDRTKSVMLCVDGSVYTCERINASAMWPPQYLLSDTLDDAIPEFVEMLELIKTHIDEE